MDNGTLALLIPVLALAIPVCAVIFGGLAKVARYRAEAASKGPSPEIDSRLQALEQEVSSLRQDLGETQERLDFTERLLARAKEDKRLSEGG